MIIKPLHSVKRFYFLDYFYVLFKSIERYQEKEKVFDAFKVLKQEYRLGESKYKTLALDSKNLSIAQVNRYRFTFGEVIDEAKEYGLVEEYDGRLLSLTEAGKFLLTQYHSEGVVGFNQSLLTFMEGRFEAFRYLVNFLYEVNKHRQGLVIFPNYSPRQLEFERSAIRTTGDIVMYSQELVKRLQKEIKEYLGEKRDLRDENEIVLSRLIDSGLLPSSNNEAFTPDKYNVITKRFRDFWVTYFLREVYGYQYSMSSFDIWTYRGKQIGIIQATEFYPNFNGRIVYPTSIVAEHTESKDFSRIYNYLDNFGLYVHKPKGNENQEKFVDYLVKAYFELRRSNRSYFINLMAIREIVCYNMKISQYIFENYLNSTYKLNLQGDLKIRIALEVDKLPEETKAIYLKQEPVMVDGKYRNIIAIDVTKGEKVI